MTPLERLGKAMRGMSPIASAQATVIGPKLAGRYEDTSKWPKDPATGQRFKEIDDSQVGIEPGYVDAISRAQEQAVAEGHGRTMSLRTDVLPHDKLDPRMRKPGAPVYYGTRSPGFDGGADGFYDPQGKLYGINTNAINQHPDREGALTSLMVHELQHELDARSGTINKGAGKPYLQQPTELRARVTQQRQKMSPTERIRFPFDQHMLVEMERVKEPGAGYGYGDNPSERGRLAMKVWEHLDDFSAAANVIDKITDTSGYYKTPVGDSPDKPGKQRHWRSRQPTWMETELQRRLAAKDK